jgi:hypothetical protein
MTEGATPPSTPPAAPLTKTADERKAILDSFLARQAGAGWRIESRSDFQATLAKGHRTNHILHLILTLITLGVWVFVWIAMVIFGGEKRRVATVDDYGNIR